MIRRALTILGLVAATSTGSISDCGSVFQITSLGLYPDPPVRNQPLYMDLQFTNTGPVISDGTVYTSLTYNGIPIAVDPKPLCQDTPCPIQQGYNNRSTATTCPDVAVGSKVTSQIKWVGSDGTTLLCIQTVLKVGATPALRGTYQDSSTTGSYYEADTTESSGHLPPVKDLVVWQAPMCLAPTVPYGPELAVGQSAPRDESLQLRVGLTQRIRSALRGHTNE